MDDWFWILGWFLSVLAMAGNGLVIFLVGRKRRLRTKTNAFVVSLAVADFCVGMSAVPSLFFCDITSGCDPTARLSDGINFIRWLFAYASFTNLCSLVLDRYIAVVKPMKYLTFMKRRRVIQMIFLSWLIPVSFIVVEATLWLLGLKEYLSRMDMCIEFLSCFILIFCFSSMFRVVCKHDNAARALAKQLRFNHRVLVKPQGKSAVKMTAIVIGLFLVVDAIFLRCSFVLMFSHHKPCGDLEYKVPLLVLNSAVNPVAYAIFKRDIKKEFKRLLYFCCLKKRN